MSTASIRLYVPAPIAQGAEIALGEAQSHYLANVLRAAAGDTLRIFDGASGEWRAAVTAISRKKMVLTAQAQTRPQAPEPDAWLCFALLKRAKTDMVV